MCGVPVLSPVSRAHVVREEPALAPEDPPLCLQVPGAVHSRPPGPGRPVRSARAHSAQTPRPCWAVTAEAQEGLCVLPGALQAGCGPSETLGLSVV